MTRMLAAIRRPYLNLDTHARPSSARALDLTSPDAWAGIKHLSNDERDQIDLQARVVLSKCADRVKEMERLEKRESPAAPRIARRAHPLRGQDAPSSSRTEVRACCVCCLRAFSRTTRSPRSPTSSRRTTQA